MTRHPSKTLYFLSLSVLITAALETQPAGQSTPQPTVSVRRIAALNQSVWPGDFNGDGITDLAASGPRGADGAPPRIVIALGNGNGTFAAAKETNMIGHVLAVADVNGDGKKDLLVADEPPPDEVVYVMFGNGDGTFTNSRSVNSFDFPTFGLVADLNGDGFQDVIVGNLDIAGGPGGVQIYPGRADGTYPDIVSLVTGAAPQDGAVADLNGDGKLDLVVANHDGRSLSVFLNQGAFMFTPSDIPLGDQVNDVVASDVNGDRKLDLLVATSSDANDDFNYVGGHVAVLRGNGNGTFAAPVMYETGAGAWQIVVGDFNGGGDGVVDVATANRSADYLEDCGMLLRGTDSLSILPGRFGGTFGAASTFAIGPQSDPSDTRFRNSVRSLNTSDVNGDGRTDLIASWGAIFTNNPPDPNWAPTVSAGPDQTTGNAQIHLQAVASDVDQDYLTFHWTASNGMFVGSVADPCVDVQFAGTYTFTVTVDDGHGHQVSDSVTYTIPGSSDFEALTFTAPAAGEIVTAGSPLTIRWTSTGHGDNEQLIFSYSTDNGVTSHLLEDCLQVLVGAHQCTWNNPNPVTEQAIIFAQTDDADVPAKGSTGVFKIRSSAGGGTLPGGMTGRDIGAVGAAGSSSYSNGVFTVSGSGADIWGTADEFHFASQTMSTQFEIVARVDSVQNVNAWTKAGLMVRTGLDPGAPQASIFVTPGKGIAFQRRTTQGGTTVHTAGAALTAPVWLKLAGYNGNIWAYYKKNLTDRWTFLGQEVIANYTRPEVGFAVTSHADGTLATAKFSQVRLWTLPDWGFGGNTGCTDGGSSHNGVFFGLFAACTDVWGTADAFTFMATRPMSGDMTITARVLDVANTHVWGKAGVMIRETGTPGSKHAFAFVTPGKGVNLQYRAATGGQSVSAATTPGAAPAWLRLTRKGDVFTASWSTDGVTFTTLGSTTVAMTGEVLVGMAYTSHNTADRGGAHFEDVVISR
jgi:regulation of enolase protein 1 (concanavalin A-like superfamily)